MCGRYTLSTPPEALAAHFALDAVPPHLDARYNIAPGQPVPVITYVEGRGRHLDLMHWGLIPSWAEDPAIGHRLFNAQAETVADKPAFRHAFAHHRCLIPADGYYLWRPSEDHKQPYRVTRTDGTPFAFAGLWAHWEAADGQRVIDSCLILTCMAVASLAHLDGRMPLILPPDVYAAWLDPHRPVEELEALLRPGGTADLQARRVSEAVNNPRNDYDALVRPID